jgi:aspartate kinase
MIVMKFGGTSVQDAAAISNVIDIVSRRLDRSPVVVLSAMAGVTNALLRVAQSAKERRFDEASLLIDEIRDRHRSTAQELLDEAASVKAIERDIESRTRELENLARSVATLGELTPRTQDAIVSFGERLSSLIVTAAMNARGLSGQLVDSREFIRTDDRFTKAAPLMDEIAERSERVLLPLVKSGCVPVAQGFIGSTLDGVTTTIGRGGSDYSAALIGSTLKADEIEIWTDVDGLMTADPRIVPTAKRIRVISFAEASELSYFGAKVLHPSTVLPAIERGIPVHIYNTLNPACEGTLIVADSKSSSSVVKSIAFKRGATVVNVNSTRMLQAFGFLHKIFEVFDHYETSVDVVTTSEVSVSMTLDDTNQLNAITRDLAGIGEVTVERKKAIVCVVGDNLKFTSGIAARLFEAIRKTNINMISQGASEINVSFVIDEDDVDSVVRSLHERFFSDADPAVFA